MCTDLTVAENRIKDLNSRKEILMESIKDILTDKREIDKEAMRLDDEISGRNLTEDDNKKKYKHEERKMRIKLEKSIVNMKQRSEVMFKKTGDEEDVSKKLLDKKLDMDRELLELTENLEVLTETAKNQREDLIKLKVRKSELESRKQLLDLEDKQLLESNAKLLLDNTALEKDNLDLKVKIHETIQRIEVNNLLKDIDIEDMQIQAKSNKEMNHKIEKMITTWNLINNKAPPEHGDVPEAELKKENEEK